MKKKEDTGNEKMPDTVFRIMAFTIKINDLFNPPSELVKLAGIKEGMTVVDYGCGPGSNTIWASEYAGETGLVYAVDIHPLAIEMVTKMAEKNNLSNIKTALAKGYNSGLENETADLVMALDMFHMIEEPEKFLSEIKRILKPDGVLFIDDGHQPRESARNKIIASGLFKIEEENKRFLRCRIKTNTQLSS
ncbi:class I SAM-dependent methyltransferase [Methanoplanus sp. FWC-SCC4]|uniref:Class I SAM-dependent methyltransferase n=1 Tax=Methanochimaera problematica TaxID=2609417 RepID=A0AA97FCF8_9EURY|nr:class I SAM-dependent methyltransferase [Methanoplanus sp. FWC-SCC4]WOF16930.1 class I SAM-dependent methyltransferase [Methanoplanus sp. FWC-SCC4]